MISLHFPTSPLGILIYFVGLLILWAILSIPVYFAGKAITKGKSDFGDAMGATLGGAIAYLVVFFAVSFFLGYVIGDSAASLFALVLALIVWLAVYRAAFRTTWIKAVGIVLLSWVFLIVISFVMVLALGIAFPDFFPLI
ncbi:MAG TPA: hypothetical protein VGR56_03460 [Nitrososphaerales archaeon]|nr:hypothetical protein [Nitrososphaerales archaeon]